MFPAIGCPSCLDLLFQVQLSENIGQERGTILEKFKELAREETCTQGEESLVSDRAVGEQGEGYRHLYVLPYSSENLDNEEQDVCGGGHLVLESCMCYSITPELRLEKR